MSFYQPEITLIKKNEISVTPEEIKGDSSMGNLTKYRMSGVYRDTINEITKNGQITLRSPFGLFDTKGPILTDENTKTKYLIQVQIKQGTKIGQLFRFEISSVNDSTQRKGKHITLNLTGYDIRTEEYIDSENLRFLTPKKAFNQRIINFTTGRDLSQIGSIKITYIDSQNLLPDDERLKQNWLPTEPLTTKELLSEIIRRASSPHIIGSTNEDWYYNIVPQADTESFRIFVDKLGSVDSGVELDVQTLGVKTMTDEINAYFDNTKYKNGLIVKCAKGKHTIPMEYTRLVSDLTHASIASSWGVGKSYLKGDYAKSGTSYYKCLITHTSSAANPPSVAPLYWENLITSTRGSPWTLNTNLWLANMSGSESPPAGYVGFFNDMNIVRKLYDKNDEFNEFETVSVKDVEDFLTGPGDIPSGQIEHGRRWLVNNGVGTLWAGHNNQIAQYDESVYSAVWRFSNSPITGDIVNLLKTATVLRFDGTIWDTIWSLNVNPAVSSPFYPIQSISKVANRNNITKAIQFRLNWNIFDSADIIDDVFNLVRFLIPEFGKLRILGVELADFIPDNVADFLTFLGLTNNADFVSTFGVGNVKNKASRRYGFNIKFPFPRRAITGNAVGSQIKKSVVDFVNLDESMVSGKKGWNEGLDTEDLGNVRGVEHWVKLLHETKSNSEVNGIANTPMIWYYRDLFDRVVYFEYTIPAHNEWQKIIIPAGFGSKLKQFDSRIDELFKAFGYVFPFNHFIKERELTGVAFDWSKVKEMGCFNKESYDDNFLYNAGQNSYLSIITEQALQKLKNLASYTGGLIDVEKVVTDHVLFAVDDIHLIKDGYVSTSETKIASPRISKINLTNQFDYINAKNIGLRKLSRLQYHPEKNIINSRGNVDIKAGQSLSLKNQFGTAEIFSITGVSHIEDATGYHCEVNVIRKYEP